MTNPLLTIEMENGDKIEIELYPEIAPNTVNNFISLVKDGFYDGLIFHRVIPDFMIQGGCPRGSGMGGPGYSIRGEFAGNGRPNPLKHQRGVISMARAAHPDSAGSQFFIMVADAPHLDGERGLRQSNLRDGVSGKIVNVPLRPSPKDQHEDRYRGNLWSGVSPAEN